MAHPFVELAKEAGLTVKQLDVLRMTIDGHSQSYIGSALGGISRQMVQQHYEAAVKKLRRYCEDNEISPDTLRYWRLDTDDCVALNGMDEYTYNDGYEMPGVMRDKEGNVIRDDS